MKRKSWANLWLFLYLNFWYIPLLAFLLGIKISLISLLVESVLENQNHGGTGGSAWKESRRQDKILTQAINKIIQDNVRQNQQLILHHHHHQEKNDKTTMRTQRLPLVMKNGGGGGENLEKNEGWAAELRKSNQPLQPEDWKILENLEYSNILPSHENRTDKNSIWLILNHVPHGGGDIISKILEDLEEENGFKHLLHEYRTPWPRFLLQEEQQSLVTWFEYQHLPRSYDRHFYFVNFTKFQKYVFENPVYINMVREPSSRLQADFQWKRRDKEKSRREVERREKISPGSGEKWLGMDFADCVMTTDPECSFENGSKDFTMTVPFFCGQFNSCVIINNRWAVQSAKFNIEKYYSVVGILERFQDSLALLQNYVPHFFTGVHNLETKSMEAYMEMTKFPPVSLKVRKILEKKLPAEYDLYNFIQSRLQIQTNFIKKRRKQR